MKKIGFYTLVSMVVLCCAMVTVGVAADETSEQAYTIDTPYEYPVLPGTPEWAALTSHGEMIRVCQISEDILHAMTTEALVETVIHYPLAADAYAYDTFEMGYEVVKNRFNGLQELERRSDVLSILSQKQVITMAMDEDDKSFEDFWTERLFSICFQEKVISIAPRYTTLMFIPLKVLG